MLYKFTGLEKSDWKEVNINTKCLFRGIRKRSVRNISGRKKATEIKVKPNPLMINVLFRPNTKYPNIMKYSRYLAD